MGILTNDGPHGSYQGPLSDERALLLLDPRLVSEVRASVERGVAREFSEAAHVWIASSGSTAGVAALPKLVALSWKALRASARAVNRHLASGAKDVWVTALPDFHVGGFGILLRAADSGARVVRTAGNLSAWDARTYLNSLRDSGANLSSLVPTQLFDLLRLGDRPPSNLRALVIGGQALGKELYCRARELGWPVLPSYGMTETASQVATASLETLERGAEHDELPVLHLLSHVEGRTSTAGLLEFSGESLLDGYLSFGAEKLVTFSDPKREGWFCSGDRGEVHERSLTVQGRVENFRKIGGELVNRQLLEDELRSAWIEVKAEGDFCILFEEDPRLGAVVALGYASEIFPQNLIEAFNRRVLPAARIRQVRQLPQIPRTALGKLKT